MSNELLRKCLKILMSLERTIVFYNGLYATDLKEHTTNVHFQLDTTEDLKDIEELKELINNNRIF